MSIDTKFEFVYGIHEGSIHEGGGLHEEVYRDMELALELAEQLVKDNQKAQNEVYEQGENEHENMFPHKWKLIGDGHWSNGIDEVHVVELRVI